MRQFCPVHSGDWWTFVSDHIHPILRNFEDPFNLQWRESIQPPTGGMGPREKGGQIMTPPVGHVSI